LYIKKPFLYTIPSGLHKIDIFLAINMYSLREFESI
jgi:hypothetical protein